MFEFGIKAFIYITFGFIVLNILFIFINIFLKLFIFNNILYKDLKK